MPDRLFLAAAFVTALQSASRKNPQSWRRIGAIGKAASIEDPDQLERAVRDAVAAGLIERQVDGDLVILTAEGWRVAGGPR